MLFFIVEIVAIGSSIAAFILGDTETGAFFALAASLLFIF